MIDVQIRQPTNGRHRIKGKISSAEFNKYVQAYGDFLCRRTRHRSMSR